MITKEEIAFAANAEMMYSKNKVIDAVYQLFGKLSEQYTAASEELPETLTTVAPKISRGENYLHLPWVMLDYPRNFSNDQTVAIRTMFWWGHYFSLHLLLQPVDKLDPEQILPHLTDTGWYFSKANTPWNHHFDDEELISIEHMTAVDMHNQTNNGFWKWSTRLPVAEWNEAESFLYGKYCQAVKVLAEIHNKK